MVFIFVVPIILDLSSTLEFGEHQIDVDDVYVSIFDC